MIDDTIENILRQIGVQASRTPLEERMLDEDKRQAYLEPGYFVDPRDTNGEVCF